MTAVPTCCDDACYEDPGCICVGCMAIDAALRAFEFETARETIRSALKGARGLALDSGEADLDAELGRAIDLLDGLA